MGKIKSYNITLDSEIVDRARTKADKQGGKLSPILNLLLAGWVEEDG